MQKTTKKIIAREFLFLLGTTTLFFIALFIWIWLYERNYQSQNKLTSEIESLTSYEKLPYRLKIFYHLNNEVYTSSSEKIVNRKEFISDLKDDTVALKIYNTLKLKDEPNYQTVSVEDIQKTTDPNAKQFLIRIAKDKESETYLQKLAVKEKELEEVKNSAFNGMGKDDEKAIILGLILLSIFFLLRYLVYAVRWSFRQLKE
ncbi:MAG TPA: hypothetical protein VFR70_04690 [Flavobacterium sp.]|nr:hypothetical protein [Flavobacterium sp.]